MRLSITGKVITKVFFFILAYYFQSKQNTLLEGYTDILSFYFPSPIYRKWYLTLNLNLPALYHASIILWSPNWSI
jgi:hypothetical protein